MSAYTSVPQDLGQGQISERQPNPQANPQPGHREIATALQGIRVTADSALVSRTQRVVRERALAMQAQSRRTRDIWLACAICSALLIMMTHSVWSGLMQYDANAEALLNTADVLDSSAQLLVMVMWFLPVSAAVVAMVVFKRNRNRRDNERLEQQGYGSMVGGGRTGSVQIVR